jgi:hypothetical protein
MAITRLGGANAISGTIPQGNIANASLGAVTALPAAIPTGKVVAVSTAEQTSGFETNNSSYTDVTGLSLSYTMQSSSNKIIFTVHGDIQRGSQDGGLGSVLVFDGSEITETKVEDPAGADNLYLPYGSAIVDGYSGAKTFKAQIRSVPGNSKAISRTGSTLTIMEYTP